MFHYYQILLCILFSTVILAQSGTNTQIISPSVTRASLATAFNYYSPLNLIVAPNAQWIWYGTGSICRCQMNITIQHFFKLNCLTSNIYLYIDCDNYYQAFINGVRIGSSGNMWTIYNYTINTSNNQCDDIFNLTIYAQNDGWGDCCGGNPAGLVYAVISDDCNNALLCSCNNLVYTTCSSQNCTGPVNYIINQTSHISKPNPLIQELSCSICGNGFFLNLQTNYCNFCSDNCLICNSTSYCFCNISNGLYLNITSNICVDCNSIGYYIDSLSNLCNPCSDNCLTCNSTSYCLSCNNSDSLYLDNTSNTCVDCNSIGYYIDSLSNLCNPCSDNCLTCNSTSYCLSCNQSASYIMDTTSNTCIFCQNGKYIDSTTHLCDSCPHNCLSCKSLYQCLSCNSSAGSYLNNQNKICTPCDSRFGYFINKTNNYCQPCVEGCVYCQNISCIKCGDRFYMNQSANICESCSQGCLVCQNQIICSYCQANYTLQNASCSLSDKKQSPSKNLLRLDIIIVICVVAVLFTIFVFVAAYCIYRRWLRNKEQIQQSMKQKQNQQSMKQIQLSQNRINQQSNKNNPNKASTQTQIDFCPICKKFDCDLIMPCDHHFHSTCIQEHNQYQQQCPNCKNKSIELVKIILCMNCKKQAFFKLDNKIVSRIQARKNLMQHQCIS